MIAELERPKCRNQQDEAEVSCGITEKRTGERFRG